MAEKTTELIGLDGALRKVVHSLEIGKYIFGASYKQLQASKVSFVIGEILATLLASDITVASQLAARESFVRSQP